MSDQEWDADDFEPHEVELPPPSKWEGEDQDTGSTVQNSAPCKQDDADSVDPKAPKKKNKLLKDKLAEKDQQSKKDLEEKKKLQESLAAKPRGQKLEEKRRQMKLKEEANLESALEAFGLGKNSRDEDISVTATSSNETSSVSPPPEPIQRT